jgi:hypothetical protein
MDELTAEQIAQNYSAMGDSVALINDVIAGNAAADRQDCVDRNTQHLELMVAKDYWTDESMTAANAAIVAGNGYTAE